MKSFLYIKKSYGFNRTVIDVYKLRTIENGNVTRIGRYLRKYFIDELPQIVNLLKGEMKIVGIRPIKVENYVNFDELININYKPALIGVDYSGVSKKNYLIEYNKRPFITDIKYFFLVMYFVIFKGVRGK